MLAAFQAANQLHRITCTVTPSYPSFPRPPTWETPSPFPCPHVTMLRHSGKWKCKHPTCRHRGRTSVLYLVTQAGMRTPILLWCHVLCMPRSQPLCCFSGDLCLIKCWFLNYPKVVRESTRKASPSLSRCALSFSRLTFQKCQPNSHTQPLPSC